MSANDSRVRYPTLKSVTGALFLICWMLWSFAREKHVLQYCSPDAPLTSKAMFAFFERFMPFIATLGVALVIADALGLLMHGLKKAPWLKRIP